jgi:hypothetical protein
LLLAVGTDALVPDGQAPNVERDPRIVRGSSSDVEHFSLHEVCADGNEPAKVTAISAQMWINQSTFPQMPWQTRIIVGVWLAREGVGTFNIFID